MQKKITVIVGHYGSGKTNLAVNLALKRKEAGEKTVLADLDIVNPYFRSADFRALMESRGIGMVTPLYAGSNLDIPALTGRLDAAISEDSALVIDVGGDDAGAAALGRYSHLIREAGGCDMYCVINRYRYLTRTSGEAAALLREIEHASHMLATGLVNNSNLGDETTVETVAASMVFAKETAEALGLPLEFTCVDARLAKEAESALQGEKLLPVQVYVKKPWDPPAF